jgi:hypothetical protein
MDWREASKRSVSTIRTGEQGWPCYGNFSGSHRDDALYQGTASQAAENSVLYQGTTSAVPQTIENMSAFRP